MRKKGNKANKAKSYLDSKSQSAINLTKIRSLYFFEFDKNFRFKGESHDSWEAVYVDKGEVSHRVGEKEVFLTTGEILFIKPNQFHSITGNSRVNSNVFVMSFDCKSPAMRFYEDQIIPVPDYLKKIITSIINEACKSKDIISMLYVPSPKTAAYDLIKNNAFNFGSLQLIKLYFTQFLILLMRNEDLDKNPNQLYLEEHYNSPLMSSIITLLNKNIYGRISLKQLSEKLYFSTTYLNTIFKKNTEQTIMNYYTELKIKEAKRLILEDRYTLLEISEMLCFDNQNYFSKTFKRVIGIAPSEYSKLICKVF